MAKLNSWQKIDRVIPYKPFGNGINGAYTSTSIPSPTYRSCTGTIGAYTLTISSGAFTNGDLIYIHQSRGTGVGQSEFNYVVAGGGTTSLTLLKPLKYTYATSGASKAQVLNARMYSSVNVTSGTWDIQTWTQTATATGGIFILVAKNSITLTNTVRINGGNGATDPANPNYGYTGGHWGGYGSNGNTGSNHGQRGEGYNSNVTSGSGNTGYTAIDSGGGGGIDGSNNSGAGGGHAATGGNGSSSAQGGLTAGSADLVTMVMGGGGGGGHTSTGSADFQFGGGGAGGGIIILISRVIDVSGATIQSIGGAGGGSASPKGGGGGAGGSVLLMCTKAILGTNKIVATGGAGGPGGGAGSVGRIAVHRARSVTGTTNPSFTEVSDPSLDDRLVAAQVIL